MLKQNEARGLYFQIVSFAGIGLINTGVDVAVYLFLVASGAHPLFANIMSFSLGAVCSFCLNNAITFRDPATPSTVARAGRFGLLVVGALAISEVVLLTALRAGATSLIAKMLATAVTVCANFWLSRNFVFKN